MRWTPAFLLVGALAACGGCVERTLTVHTNPPGALVYMNDIEVGRTPLNKRFVWYGTYDVQVRKEGYQTLRTTTPVIAPWWQWMPFDFLAEILPLRLEDTHTVAYTLAPQKQEHVNPEAIVGRGEELRDQLESSQRPPPATRPAKRARRPGRK